MITEKLRQVQLIFTLIIAAQGIFYLLGTAKGLKTISVSAFAEQRKAIDTVIAGRLQILYYLSLLSGIAVMIAYRREPGSMVFLLSLTATLLIIADILLAVKCSLPVNKAFQQYPENTGADWRSLQIKWLNMILVRGGLSFMALIVLLLSFARK